MPPMFDPDEYTTVPTRTPGATLSLARSLLAAAPSRPKRAVAKRLARLRERAELLQAAWIDVHRPAATESVRPLDVVLDRRWGAVRSRLDAAVLLTDDDHAPRAQVLLDALFPTGLDFLTLPFAEEWAQSERRLALIESDGLADELDALVGPEYLPALRQAHVAYGEALGITKAKEAAPEAARVLGPLRDLQAAIASYARGVVGTVDEDDEEAVREVMQQLEPILRARPARRGGGGEAEEAGEQEEPIEAPLPELPAESDAAAQ